MSGTGQGGYWFAAAVRASGLPPTARHIAHVLASVANNETGRIKVSLSWLEQATGLARSTVAKHLNTLEREGWIRRTRAEVWAAVKLHDRTEYTTTIPVGYPTEGSPSRGLGSTGDGLGVVRKTSKASPPDGLSTTSTKAGAPSAGASGAAAGTNREVAAAHPERRGLPPTHTLTVDCCNLPDIHPVHREAS